MTQTVKLLESILKGVQMGAFSIEQLSEENNNAEFADLLKKQREEYLNILHEVKKQLRDNGHEPIGLRSFAYKASVISVKINVKAENSVPHFAQMMIQGSTMGINKLTEAYRHFREKASDDAKSLAKRTLKTEINNIETLLQYLD